MNQLYPTKEVYNCVIPQNIFQTWHTKKLPPLMFASIEKLKKNNPCFKHYLYDDNECREFIKNNYDSHVLNAFDNLIPGAYKADLWRYCILYRYGGIYLDIKYVHTRDFKLINLIEKEHWVLDADNFGIYNALLVCKQGNPILLRAINQIVQNVKNKFYGTNCLQPTGPQLLSMFFTEEEKQNFDMKHNFVNTLNNRYITLNKIIVMASYKGYLQESKNYQIVNHYGVLWNNRQIYK